MGGVSALPLVVSALACPVCRAEMILDAGADIPGSLRCASGHAFDVSRQGHVSLFDGGARAGTGDTVEMVAQRSAFLGSGHYAPLADALGETVRAGLTDAGSGPSEAPLLLDVAGGTGWYAARVLEANPGMRGLSLDLSAAASRRAARAHPRLASVVADAWRPLPLRDGAVSVATSVFGPRDADELHRLLQADGRLIVVTPTPRHLAEVREGLGMLSMDPRKDARLAEQLARFRLESDRSVEWTLRLAPADLTALVLMGPSAHHVSPDAVHESVARLLGEDPAVDVTASVRVSVWIPSTAAALPG